MDPVDVLRVAGGVAGKARLLEACTEREVAAALRAGLLVRLARGQYALPHVRHAQREAARLSGAIAHLSAAQVHGWEVGRVPERPWVAVPRNRNVSAADRLAVNIVHATVSGPVTDPMRTIMDCARRLPFGEGLAVADSALRHRAVDKDELVAAADAVRGKGAANCRRVAAEATPLAANPLESMLRAIALDVPGLSVRPQVEIGLPGFVVHPDLVDENLRIVVEAEGFVYHGTSAHQFDRDLERYTLLVVDRWLVARFSRAHVMDQQQFVTDALTALVQTSTRQQNCRCVA